MTQLFMSEQDLDLLHHIARGDSYDQAALKFGITGQTVKNRISHLLLTFGASSITHLVAICIASDIIRVQDLYMDLDVVVLEYQRKKGKKRKKYNLRAVRV